MDLRWALRGYESSASRFGRTDVNKEFQVSIAWEKQVIQLLLNLLTEIRSRDSAVGIATGYGLDDRGVGVRVPVGSRIFSSPRSPHRLCGTPSLLSNGYRGLFPQR
jgi:hypothetical protein